MHRELDAFVVAARFSRDGRTLAFGMGDGTVRLVPVADPANEWRSVPVMMVPCFPSPRTRRERWSFRAAMMGSCGGSPRPVNSDIAGFGMKWVEQVATYASDRGKGLIAAGVGKIVQLFDETGTKLKE